jgi:tetratricopeptide (TPR) repeat protein
MNEEIQPVEPIPANSEPPQPEPSPLVPPAAIPDIPPASMSEMPPPAVLTAVTPAAPARKSRKKWVIIGVILAGFFGLLLVALYYGGGYLLTQQVDEKFAARDCQGVAETGKTVQSLFPESIVPFVAPALNQYEECLPYADAQTAQAGSDWENAYKNYVKYYEQNPKGILVDEAREGAAQSLLSWAQKLAAEKEYSTAIDKLTTLLQDYETSAVFDQGRESMASTYQSWAAQLAEAQDFETAIAKLDIILTEYANTSVLAGAREDKAKYLVGWARELQSKQDYPTAVDKLKFALAEYEETAAVAEAKILLPQLYYEWAQIQESQAQYAEAEANYKNAMTKDPNPQSATGPTALTHAALPGFYIKWGNVEADAGEFDRALKHYELARDYAPNDVIASINEYETRLQVNWASDLGKGEKFFSALSHLEAADKVASDSLKSEVSKVRDSILEAFSKSDGADAVTFIKQTTKDLCMSAKLPSLPIAGIDTSLERVFDYFVSSDDTLKLNAAVLATTPGSLHLVACVSETKVTIAKCGPYGPWPSGPFDKWVIRQRVDWSINLLDVTSGEKVGSKNFQGSAPEGCNNWEIFLPGTKELYKVGDPPTSGPVNNWLEEFVK